MINITIDHMRVAFEKKFNKTVFLENGNYNPEYVIEVEKMAIEQMRQNKLKQLFDVK